MKCRPRTQRTGSCSLSNLPPCFSGTVSITWMTENLQRTFATSTSELQAAAPLTLSIWEGTYINTCSLPAPWWEPAAPLKVAGEYLRGTLRNAWTSAITIKCKVSCFHKLKYIFYSICAYFKWQPTKKKEKHVWSNAAATTVSTGHSLQARFLRHTPLFHQ